MGEQMVASVRNAVEGTVNRYMGQTKMQDVEAGGTSTAASDHALGARRKAKPFCVVEPRRSSSTEDWKLKIGSG